MLFYSSKFKFNIFFKLSLMFYLSEEFNLLHHIKLEKKGCLHFSLSHLVGVIFVVYVHVCFFFAYIWHLHKSFVAVDKSTSAHGQSYVHFHVPMKSSFFCIVFMVQRFTEWF